MLLTVKDGHLTILTNCPFLSFCPELPNYSHLESVMVCVMVKVYSKFNFEKKKKRQEMEHYTVTIVGTGKSIDFYLFVKVGYYPSLALSCACILLYIVIVYCI